MSATESMCVQLGTVTGMTSSSSDARAPYDAVAREYAVMNQTAPYNALYERPAVISLLGDVAAQRVLDVGCGSGILSRTSSSMAPRSSVLMPVRR